ncbi:Bcr/CflA family efflux MFS transporter [Rhodobacteraceae bacterium RKSG542]|nr:Bcr/CflA family efflux MFS transporter [Pseudovibrio flavus]
MSFPEFVALIAALMALNALSIDIMLPGLPDIGKDFGLTDPNERQLLITSYLVGLAFASLIFGPISDWIGRKKVLLFGIVLFAFGAFLSAMSDTFGTLLLSRAVQGIGAAAPRVVTVSMVRDWYEGRQMGRVMSLAMMVFMAAPILAPSIGQSILFIGPWEWIFAFLTLFGVCLLAWCYTRLPESLEPENRRRMSFGFVLNAYKTVLTTRLTFGYMLAMSFVFGGLMSFINSAQQIFVDIFDLGTTFPIVFAVIAASLSLASYLNARFVEKYGLRRLSHMALFGYTAVSIIHAIVALSGLSNLATFICLQMLIMFFFGFIGPNFNTMAMEPLAKIAGTGSAMIGFFSTLVSALLGAAVGAMFDGTIIPFTLGFSTFGILAMITVYITEGGEFMKPQHEQ